MKNPPPQKTKIKQKTVLATDNKQHRPHEKTVASYWHVVHFVRVRDHHRSSCCWCCTVVRSSIVKMAWLIQDNDTIEHAYFQDIYPPRSACLLYPIWNTTVWNTFVWDAEDPTQGDQILHVAHRNTWLSCPSNANQEKHFIQRAFGTPTVPFPPHCFAHVYILVEFSAPHNKKNPILVTYPVSTAFNCKPWPFVNETQAVHYNFLLQLLHHIYRNVYWNSFFASYLEFFSEFSPWIKPKTTTIMLRRETIAIYFVLFIHVFFRAFHLPRYMRTRTCFLQNPNHTTKNIKKAFFRACSHHASSVTYTARRGRVHITPTPPDN